MKRTLLLVAVLASLAAAVDVSAAAAKTPCRDRIYNDWYADGKIASTYPKKCYLDALNHIRSDADTYSNLRDDIEAALRASLLRAKGQHVASQVGEGLPKPRNVLVGTKGSNAPRSTDANGRPVRERTEALAPVSATTTSTSSSGLPLPVILLGVLAVVLAAAGLIGLGVKRFGQR
jgi:hypothetical protein